MQNNDLTFKSGDIIIIIMVNYFIHYTGLTLYVLIL